VGLLCRTSERSDAAAHGTRALAEELGRRLGAEPRLVGSPPVDAAPAHYDSDLARSRGCLLEAGGQVEDALTAGAMPILVSGHCPVCMTTLPAVARARPDVRLLWLDAHGDFNTPQTTESDFLGGMCLAAACGRWDAGLDQTAFDPRRVVMCGVRDLDAGERVEIDSAGPIVIGAQLETLVYLTNALDGAPVFVHLDLDVLDPEIFPAQYPADGGITDEKLLDLLEAVASAAEIVGVEITGFEAPPDDAERDRLARLVADAVEPLLP
jgi:arginase